MSSIWICDVNDSAIDAMRTPLFATLLIQMDALHENTQELIYIR